MVGRGLLRVREGNRRSSAGLEGLRRAGAPDELSSLAFFWSVPPGEPFPAEHHGKPVFIVAAAYSGSVEDGEPVVQPLRELAEPLIDLSGPWPWLGLQSGFDELFPAGDLRYWKSRALAELTQEAMDDIVDWAGRRPTPLTDIAIWHHGGAMSRVGETETAYAGRDAPFLVTGEASWTDPAQNDEAIAWGREFWAAMERHSTGGLYLNFPGLGEEKEELVKAGYGANYERLAALKAEYDPSNLFRMNLNITPGGELDRLELLERLAAALAVTDRAARGWAEDVFEPRLRRAAIRALERLALELDQLRAAGFPRRRRSEPGLAQLLAALGRDPVGRPRVVEDHLDVRLRAELADPLGHLVAHHLECRAAEEGRRELDVDGAVLDRDIADDAEVDDRDRRDLGIRDLGERVPDVSFGQSKSVGHSGWSR